MIFPSTNGTCDICMVWNYSLWCCPGPGQKQEGCPGFWLIDILETEAWKELVGIQHQPGLHSKICLQIHNKIHNNKIHSKPGQLTPKSKQGVGWC